MLLPLLISPLVGCVVLSFIDKTNHKLIQNFSLFWSLVVLNFSFLLLFFFDQTTPEFQFIFECFCINSVNINLIWFRRVRFINDFCFHHFWYQCVFYFVETNIKNQIKNYCFAFFFRICAFGVFSSLDIMLFYLLLKRFWYQCF